MTPGERVLAAAQAVRRLMIERLEGHSLDADEKREMQAALEELDRMWEELRRYAEFFEYAPDACFITDTGGSVREANQAALELLRMRRDEIVTRPLADYIECRKAADEVEASVRPIALTKSGSRGLCWLVRPKAEPA